MQLVQLKNVQNTREGVLILVKLQAVSCVFITEFKQVNNCWVVSKPKQVNHQHLLYLLFDKTTQAIVTLLYDHQLKQNISDL